MKKSDSFFLMSDLHTLRNRNRFYASIPSALLIIDMEDTIVMANNKAQGMLGVKKTGLLNSLFSQFVAAADITTYKLARANAIESNTPQSCEVRLQNRKGLPIWCRLDLGIYNKENDPEQMPEETSLQQSTLQNQSVQPDQPIQHDQSIQHDQPIQHDQSDIINCTDEPCLLILITDITYQKKIEDTQAFLLGNSWAPIKQDFFVALSEYLADMLDADYVCIDRLHGNLEAETMAVYYNGVLKHNIRYSLRDTPCGKVVGNQVCCFPQSVRVLFPNDPMLKQIGAEGYLGITLWGASGKAIGLISVVSRKPLGDTRAAAKILKQVSIRAAAELEHRIAQKRFASLSKSSQAMLNSADEIELAKKVCEIITNDCGYALMWIGLALNDENKSVVPLASAGFEEGYLETLNITWSGDDVRGRGPTGTAIRTGIPYVCNNLLTDPNFLPWRDEAIKRGYASSMALPMRHGDKILGGVMIYARDPGYFDHDEITHLSELANGLSHGIVTKRLEKDMVKALAELKKAELNRLQ